MDNGVLYIIGQILGVIAVLVGFLAFQRKTQLGIVVFECAAAVIFAVHYLLISAPTAAALNLLSGCVCVFFAIWNKKQMKGNIWIVINCLLIAVSGVLTWDSIYSAFLIAGLVFNTVTLSFKNPQNTRKAMLIKSPLCLVYNVAVASVGGVIFECAVLTSALIGLIRNGKDNKQ